MEQILAVAVGMIDVIMIASVGEAAVSGVSLVDNVSVLLIGLFGALATGGAVVTGHYLGQNDKKNACKAANQLILFTVLSSLLIMALFFLERISFSMLFLATLNLMSGLPQILISSLPGCQFQGLPCTMAVLLCFAQWAIRKSQCGFPLL